jgi:hypothetical protein
MKTPQATSDQRDANEDYEQDQGNGSYDHYRIFGYVEW